MWLNKAVLLILQSGQSKVEEREELIRHSGVAANLVRLTAKATTWPELEPDWLPHGSKRREHGATRNIGIPITRPIADGVFDCLELIDVWLAPFHFPQAARAETTHVMATPWLLPVSWFSWFSCARSLGKCREACLGRFFFWSLLPEIGGWLHGLGVRQ